MSLDTVELAVYLHVTEDVLIIANGGRGVGSDTVCWEADMRPGIHVADVVIWTSTGEEFTYSWAFEVVP